MYELMTGLKWRFALGLAAGIAWFAVLSPGHAASEKELVFNNVQSQTREFIGYYDSIQLNPEQQQLMNRVLSTLPAPCCKEYSIRTCCCPCNLAKSVWGLSHHLIANKGFDAQQLRQAVLDWMKFTNPAGYSGDACYTGGCQSPFSENGCGGMKADRIIF